LALGVVFALAFASPVPVRAQTYSVLYNFETLNGSASTSTLLMDRAGRLYGTLDSDTGSVFQVRRAGSGWVLDRLRGFGLGRGQDPVDFGGLTTDPDGSLYGTTVGNAGLGTVFKLSPPPTACTTALCSWDLTVLYEFAAQVGLYAESNVVFDAAGNLYGTAKEGGANGGGSVYELSPSDGGWTATAIYSFDYSAFPSAGVVMDGSGNLYGVAPFGRNGNLGLVYRLTPSGSGWTEHDLYQFAAGGADGLYPTGGLIFDAAGNLYGSTMNGGTEGGGTLFELSPSNGGWTLTTLCNFAGNGGPVSPLTMDAIGNLYGTTEFDGNGLGSVFKATRSGGKWTCNDLYDFELGTGGNTPIAGVTLDASGNLYGTTSEGGTNNDGVVWKITP
jgi:uncharacterized repeat protein (TIGR03803 family)